MSKRSNGESSIHKDASGTWHAYVTVGTRRTVPSTAVTARAKTRAEVLRRSP